MLLGLCDGLPEPLTRLSTTGLLRDYDARLVERWIDVASGGGLIGVTDDKYYTLSLTTLGRNVMAGRVSEISLVQPRADRIVRKKRLRRRKSTR